MLSFQAVIVQSEDGYVEWRNHGYIVHANIEPDERNAYREEKYISFVYPGNTSRTTAGPILSPSGYQME